MNRKTVFVAGLVFWQVAAGVAWSAPLVFDVRELAPSGVALSDNGKVAFIKKPRYGPYSVRLYDWTTDSYTGWVDNAPVATSVNSRGWATGLQYGYGPFHVRLMDVPNGRSLVIDDRNYSYAGDVNDAGYTLSYWWDGKTGIYKVEESGNGDLAANRLGEVDYRASQVSQMEGNRFYVGGVRDKAASLATDIPVSKVTVQSNDTLDIQTKELKPLLPEPESSYSVYLNGWVQDLAGTYAVVGARTYHETDVDGFLIDLADWDHPQVYDYIDRRAADYRKNDVKGVNDAAWVVGMLGTDTDYFPYLWRPGGSLFDLRTTLPGYRNLYVYDVNNLGQILLEGKRNSDNRFVTLLLTPEQQPSPPQPVSEPAVLWMLLGGLPLVAARIRRIGT